MYIIIFLLLCLPVWAEQTLRINLGRQESITLTGKDLTAATEDGDKLTKNNSLTFTASGKGIILDNKQTGVNSVYVTADVIQIGSKIYHDNIEVLLNTKSAKPELLLIHVSPLESYLVSVVASEIPTSAPMEALKAQAIAARTYALKQKYRRLNGDFHVVSTVMDQVFDGAGKKHPRVEEAVKETTGEVITYNNELIDAYFHSTCGDHTESAKEGWGKAVSYLPGVECKFCTGSKTHNWQLSLGKEELNKLLGSIGPTPVSDIRIISKTATGRAKQIAIYSGKRKKLVSGLAFRNAVGNNRLRSTWITNIQMTPAKVTFTGQGFGHGVGLCQMGAIGMAKAGKSAEEILTHYFPGTTIRQMY